MKKKVEQVPLVNGLVVYEDQKVDCIVSYCASLLNAGEMKELTERLIELSKQINKQKK